MADPVTGLRASPGFACSPGRLEAGATDAVKSRPAANELPSCATVPKSWTAPGGLDLHHTEVELVDHIA